MGLFKDVKKPVIRQATRAAADISPLRPKLVAKQPPCAAQCAAGADVRAWITTIARAEAYARASVDACATAWGILADAQPFPATLGRICPHPCERACFRAGKDGAVGINAIERWLGDVALARGFALPQLPHSARTGRVAVVGAGPAGLSCAYQLSRRGHRVTIFEARELPGGRLRDATRTGRLATAIVDAEIARIIRLGVDLRCATAIGKDLAGLDAGYDFVCVATGRAGRASSAPAKASARRIAAGDAARAGLVPAAVASGRAAAGTVDAAINDSQPESMGSLPAIDASRVTLAWYADAPRLAAGGDAGGAGEAALVAEAKRCMSCGLCMDCEQCWMYCTNNCFEKPARSASTGPKPGAYRLNVETCNGCRKCADQCPCGYIDMV